MASKFGNDYAYFIDTTEVSKEEHNQRYATATNEEKRLFHRLNTGVETIGWEYVNGQPHAVFADFGRYGTEAEQRERLHYLLEK